MRTTNASAGVNAVWEDLTPYFQNALNGPLSFNGGAVTSIAVDPKDPDRIWIGLARFDRTYKVIHLYKENGNWQWFNLSDGLPDFSVNDVVFQEGSNNWLYAATDVGVWFNPDGSDPNSKWECYSEDLPVAYIMDLEIQQCSGMLYAGTFGHGIWASSLVQNEDFVVPFSKIWQDDREIFNANVIIKSGATLEIKGRVTLSANRYILVEPGAKLLLNGGILTNECELWEGVIVQGDPDENQYPISAPTHQGLVEIINDGTIENAKVGVRLFDPEDPDNSSGGVLIATDAYFTNNQIGVQFKPYQNFDSSNQLVGNHSSFEKCEFVVNNDFHEDYLSFAGHAHLNTVTGIEFIGCTFANDINLSHFKFAKEKGPGILSYNSDFTVRALCLNPQSPPCTSYKRGEFRGMGIAIDAANSRSINTFRVSKTDFVRNYVGISAHLVHYAYIVDNDFIIGNTLDLKSDEFPFQGIRVYRGTGFKIEENHFDRTAPIGAGNVPLGISVVYAGDDYNEVYKNTLEKLHVGNLACGDNKSDQTGLAYLCNENTTNTFDFAVDDENNDPETGIASEQGSAILPAGNTFTAISGGLDYHIYNEGSSLTYFYDNSEPSEQPTEITIANVFPSGVNIQNTCPSRLPASSEDGVLNSTEKQAFEQTLENSLVEQERQLAANNLIRDATSSNNGQLLTEARAFLKDKGTLISYFSIVDSWLQEQELDSAQQSINEIIASITFSAKDSLEYQYFHQLKTAQIQALQTNQSESQFVNDSLALLTGIAQAGEFYASVQAQSLINSILPGTFEVPVFYPESGSNPASPFVWSLEQPGNFKEHHTLFIYPNPAYNNTRVHYKLPEEQSSGNLSFYNSAGKLLQEVSLETNTGIIHFDLSELKNGMYFYYLSVGGKYISTIPLVIAK